MANALSNAWKTIQAMSPDTEIWWDSSPLVWPNFKEDFLKNKLSDEEKAWFKQELETLYWDAPASSWIFKGCTTNPPLSWAVLKTRKEEWAGVIKEKRKAYKGRSKYGLFTQVYFEVVKRGAEKLLPIFEASGGKYGHVSGQVDMQQMRNEAAMKEMGEQLAALSPNVMVKIPGSTQGIPVFKHLASKGIATNATCVFTVPQIMAVANSVAEGRKLHLKEKSQRFGWRAVCTHMTGRLEDSKAFRGVVDKDNLNINALEMRAASELGVKKCARLFKERNLPIKMLTCSARLHRCGNDWFYPHVDMFMGGNLVYTIPPKVFGDVLLHYRNRELKPHWNDEVPQETIEKLNQVPYFRLSSEEDGYAIEQFNEIPSLLENEVEFVGATKEMMEYVGSFL
jgi:transaldolase